MLESGLGLQLVILVRCHGGMTKSLLDMAAKSFPRRPCFVGPGLILVVGLVDLLQRRKAAAAAESALRQGTAHLLSRRDRTWFVLLVSEGVVDVDGRCRFPSAVARLA